MHLWVSLAACTQPKWPNRICSLDFWWSVYSSSNLFFLTCICSKPYRKNEDLLQLGINVHYIYQTLLKNIIKVSAGIFSSFLFQNKVIFQSPSSFCLALTVQSFAIRLMGRLTVKVHLEGKCEIPSPFLKLNKMGWNTLLNEDFHSHAPTPAHSFSSAVNKYLVCCW